MRGSTAHQVTRVFAESGIFTPGDRVPEVGGKHGDRQAAQASLAQEGRSATSQAIASKTGLHSYEYARDAKDTWHRCAQYAREHLGIKDVSKLDGQTVASFLEKRIADGISKGTWSKEAAHLGKLENALQRFSDRIGLGREYDFRNAINDKRELAYETLSIPDHSQGFNDPMAVRDGLEGKAALVAALQHEGGCRLSEACLVRSDQLRGVQGEHGVVSVQGKGGKVREVRVMVSTYNALAKATARGALKISKSSYAKTLDKAAKAAHEMTSRSHNFRYCYAQERYEELTRGGASMEEAIQRISWDMGHERANITLHYLGR